MAYSSPVDGSEQTWLPEDNEGYHISSNGAWSNESSVDAARELYGTQPVSGSDANTPPLGRDAIARTNPRFEAYYGGNAYQQPTEMAYSSTGSSGVSRGLQTMPKRQISPPGHGMSVNWPYNYTCVYTYTYTWTS